MRIGRNSIIYRRNVYCNERSFPARKLKLPPTLTSIDDGSELIGLEFEDDNERWTVTKVGFHDDHPILYYTNNKTGEEERSSVAEVKAWYHRTTLKQAISQVTPTRKGYINTIAEESYKAITYDVKLPPHATKPTSFKKAGNTPFPQWFRAEDKERQGFLIRQSSLAPHNFICHHTRDPTPRIEMPPHLRHKTW